jgi:hypothetical protein
MSTYLVKGRGRKRGAIGIFHPFSIEVVADNQEDAQELARLHYEPEGPAFKVTKRRRRTRHGSTR